MFVIVNVFDDNDNVPVFIQSGYKVIFYIARLTLPIANLENIASWYGAV